MKHRKSFYNTTQMDVKVHKEVDKINETSIHNQLIDIRKQIDELNKFREYTQSCIVSNHTQHIDSRKEIANLKSEVSSLKETNEYLMKNLKEQIQLNSKLCERIFEMKEDKFKNEKS
jgi:paraquat-inducible protein B